MTWFLSGFVELFLDFTLQLMYVHVILYEGCSVRRSAVSPVQSNACTRHPAPPPVIRVRRPFLNDTFLEALKPYPSSPSSRILYLPSLRILRIC